MKSGAGQRRPKGGGGGGHLSFGPCRSRQSVEHLQQPTIALRSPTARCRLAHALAAHAPSRLRAGSSRRCARAWEQLERHRKGSHWLHARHSGAASQMAAPTYRRPLPGERYAYGGLSCVISAVVTNPVDVVKIR